MTISMQISLIYAVVATIALLVLAFKLGYKTEENKNLKRKCSDLIISLKGKNESIKFLNSSIATMKSTLGNQRRIITSLTVRRK